MNKDSGIFFFFLLFWCIIPQKTAIFPSIHLRLACLSTIFTARTAWLHSGRLQSCHCILTRRVAIVVIFNDFVDVSVYHM